VGDSFLLVARVHDGQAARLPGRPVEWSSDSAGVLRVNATKAVATAIAPGTAIIRAICDGNEGRLRVTVAPPRADAILVKPLEKPITVGEEVRLEATPRDKRGRVVTRPVTWRSDDDAVATISLEGVLVARSSGSTRITAELDEARTNVAVTILPPPVVALHISPPPESVVTGDSFALTATPLDRWAGPLTGRTVAWSVSDVNVAMVTAGGWVITRNPGLVVLTAICEGCSASVSVSVVEQVESPLPVEAPSRSPGARSREEPEAWDLPTEPPQLEPRRSRAHPGWLVAAGGAFLVAGSFWLVGGRRPIAPPTAETAAITEDSSPSDPGVKSGGSPIRVNSNSAASVIIIQRPAKPLIAGSSTSLTAEVRDSAGGVLPGGSVSWSTTNPAVAVVDSANGTLRAVGPGRAEVIASSGEWRDSARIVVRPAGSGPLGAGQALPASLSIPPHDPLRVGDTATLPLSALDRKGNPVRAARVTWSSSEPQVAAVDAAGKVRAHSTGSTLIIARSGSESAMLSLSVLPAAVASVRVEGAVPLKVGDTLALRAEPRDQWGGGIGERPIIWSSSNPAVVSVDSASGLVEARAAGSAAVTATSEGKSGSVRLTVLPQPRTGRTEPPLEAVAQRATDPSPEQVAAEHQRVIDQMVAGVEQCYGALQEKDVDRVQELYKAATRADQDKLKKLSRILRTDEWAAEVGAREDGAQRIENDTATMDFSFRLTWKDAFGGRLNSQPVFRAEFARNGSKLDLSNCRIIGSPKL
jgi:uncharacterized protein YjdB